MAQPQLSSQPSVELLDDQVRFAGLLALLPGGGYSVQYVVSTQAVRACKRLPNICVG